MIPTKTIEELIEKHSTLEKDLSSGNLDNKLFAEKSKEYSDVNEIILNAKKYLSFENEKKELEILLKGLIKIKNEKNISIPLVVKLSPDIKDKDISEIMEIIFKFSKLANKV